MTRYVITFAFVYPWNNIYGFEKKSLFPLFPRYLTLYQLFREHIALKFSENKGIVLYTFCFTRKTKVSNVRVKSKIVTFASQSATEFKQFLTKSNLTLSVAKNDRRVFSVLIFHETISNWYRYQNPFKRVDMKSEN